MKLRALGLRMKEAVNMMKEQLDITVKQVYSLLQSISGIGTNVDSFIVGVLGFLLTSFTSSMVL
jgi:hypothetical protein